MTPSGPEGPAITRAPADEDAMRLETLRAEPAAGVDAFLERFLSDHRLPGDLHAAVTYAVLGGGKRLRPVLCWHCAVAVGGHGARPRDGATREHPGLRAVPAAAAFELVHAFSLVHDDLPAMDDDDVRRGRPTLHIHAGEAMAILAGDAMLALAFAAMHAPPFRGAPYPPALRAALAQELSRGTLGMIAGQVHDTFGRFPAGMSDLERVEHTHRHKTGALLRAACRAGALVALDGDQASPALDAVSRYADAIGLMFQIVDDLVDVEQPAERAGKATGKDAAAGKLTYPAVLGVEGSRRRVAELKQAAMDAVAPLGERAADLGLLCRYLARRDT